MFPPLGAHTLASRIFRISSFGTGSGFNRRIDRVVLMISNRLAVFGAESGIACSVIRPIRWKIAMLLIGHRAAMRSIQADRGNPATNHLHQPSGEDLPGLARTGADRGWSERISRGSRIAFVVSDFPLQ
jgi:hypothetical protein